MSKYTWLVCLATSVALAACNGDNGDAVSEVPSSSGSTAQQPVTDGSTNGANSNAATSNATATTATTTSGLKMQFADLQGNSGNITTSDVAIDGRLRLHDFGVTLYKILQSRQDYNAVKEYVGAGRNIPSWFVPSVISSAPLMPDVQADYFDRNTVVIVDAHSARLHQLELVELSELEDKIQVAFELCSFDSMFEGTHFNTDIWFAIPKTTKPVEVLPLRYPPNPGWHPFNPEMGTPKCSFLLSKDGK